MTRTIDWIATIGENQELSVEGTVEYTVTPGDPGCRYTRNGDGWPPTPPEVEFYNERITKVMLSCGELETIISLEKLDAAARKQWAETWFGLVDKEWLTTKALEESEPAEREYEPEC